MTGILGRALEALRAVVDAYSVPGDAERLRAQLVRHLGSYRYLARDPATGRLVVGHGRPVDEPPGGGPGGLEPAEMAMLLERDIAHAVGLLHEAHPWTRDLAPARMGVLIELAIHFKSLCPLAAMTGFLTAAQDGRYGAAALALLGSAWARQVGVGRPDKLAQQMHTGEWQA